MQTEYKEKEIAVEAEDSLAWDNSEDPDRGGGGRRDLEQGGDPMVSVSIPEHHAI